MSVPQSETPNSLQAKDIAYSIHPYTDLTRHKDVGPVVIVKGDGVRIEDDAGNRYIEMMAGLWCTSLGFSEQRLIDAATRQMKAIPFAHNFAHRANEPAIELAYELAKLAPAGLDHVFFTSSGSEAVDTAIKLVWYYNNAIGQPKKKKIISRRMGYHGVTVASGSATGLPVVHAAFDLPIDRFLHTDTPCHYRCAEPGETESEFCDRIVANLRQLIETENPETVAAFIAEPFMAGGGAMMPPEGYFEKVQKVLEEHDILFIADEVVCGFYRTGNTWGSETFGIEPDIMILGKQLSSAYLPIGAVLVSRELYDGIERQSGEIGVFGTGFTHTGNAVCAAVALEALRIYKERNILEYVRALAPHLQERLHGFAEHPLVGDVRGVGLVGGIEIVRDKETNEHFSPEWRANAVLVQAGMSCGVMTRTLPGDAIGVSPPLIITELELDEMFDRLGGALDQAYEQLQAG